MYVIIHWILKVDLYLATACIWAWQRLWPAEWLPLQFGHVGTASGDGHATVLCSPEQYPQMGVLDLQNFCE